MKTIKCKYCNYELNVCDSAHRVVYNTDFTDYYCCYECLKSDAMPEYDEVTLTENDIENFGEEN